MIKRRKADKAPAPPGVTVYEPRKGWALLNLRELWNYRELTYFLAMRDITVRYRQAVLGIAWVIVQPIAVVVVAYAVFSQRFNVDSGIEGVPYILFNLSGVVLWSYFTSSLSRATSGLVGQAGLLTKVYFPRLVIPTSAMITGLVDLAIGLAMVFGLMGYFGIVPSWQFALFPVFIIVALLTALAVGLWMGPLNLLYRDVRSFMPFIIQLGVFLSPVYYAIDDKFGETMRIICRLNPMTGAIDGMRWSLLGGEFDPQYFLYSLGVVLLLLVGGLFFFKRMERTFADKV